MHGRTPPHSHFLWDTGNGHIPFATIVPLLDNMDLAEYLATAELIMIIIHNQYWRYLQR